MNTKYSQDNLNELTYKDYILLIAKELNNNGFADDKGEVYKVGTDINGNFVSDFSRGFILSIKDKEAIDFLKEIGLFNNGRCPLTGLMLSDKTTTKHTSEYDSHITYDISTLWEKYTKSRINWGCIVPIPIIIIGIIIGFIYSFSTMAYVVIGIGILVGISSIMHRMSKFGNNWNTICLSNALGMNTITLFHIQKLRKSNVDITYQMIKMLENGIPSGDLLSYMNLENQERLERDLQALRKQMRV